jgi:hypothetical protein
MLVSGISLTAKVYAAPIGARSIVSQNYKHLAPPEPDSLLHGIQA